MGRAMGRPMGVPMVGGGSAEATALALDNVTSAVLAFSVSRKLRTAYTGSAIRVRRSSDDAEQDIGFSGNDLDTASLESFCGAGDGFLVTKYDAAGTANNATSAIAAEQPQIVSVGSVITVNGKPAADYDGTDDELETGANTGISGTQQRAIIAVLERGANTLDGVADIGVEADTQDYTLTSEYAIRTDGGNEVFLSTPPSALELVVLVFPEGSDNVEDHILYLDGSEVAQTSVSAQGVNTTDSPALIGNSRQAAIGTFDGRILEMMIFNDDLSGGVRESLEQNIADFYGITLSA